MYYYIFQAPANRRIKKIYDRIKLKIGLMGISGESVLSSPLRTVEELTELGLTKGYKTIIAVGSDSFINQVAHFLINISLAQDREKIVLGAIPLNYQSRLAEMMRVRNLEETINALRQRKLRTIDAAFIEPNKFFILPIEIKKNQNQPFYAIISTKKFLVKGLMTQIQITPSLVCRSRDVAAQNNWKQKLLTYFTPPSRQTGFSSFFHAKTFTIESNELIPVNIEEKILAKTPIKVHTIPRLLQLIVARDIITEKETS